MTATADRPVRDLLWLTRAHNCLTAAGATALGAYLAGGAGVLGSSRTLRACLVVAAVCAVGNVVNDRLDIDADRLGKPDRPLAAGRLTDSFAAGLARWLGAGAMAVALTLGLLPALAAGLLLGLAVAYSHRLKSTVVVGNVVVAALSASTIAYGALVVGGAMALAVASAVLVFLFMVAFEVLKTLEDAGEDGAVGTRTVATVLGARPTVYVARAVGLCLVGTTLAMWALRVAPPRYAAGVGVASVLPATAVVFAVSPDAGRSAVRSAVRVMKVAWFTGLAAMAVLR